MPHTLIDPAPIYALLDSYRALADRHKAALDPYLDADGELEADREEEYDEQELAIARETRQWLEEAMSTLTELVRLPDGQQVTVPGRDGLRFPLITGTLDDNARAAFRTGQCHAMARALSDTTGWPMAVLISDYCGNDPDLCGAEEVSDGVCACQLEHLVVVHPDGVHIDITGAYPPGTVPDYEDQEAIAVDERLWSHLLRSPNWRRPALDVARTFVGPLMASLPPALRTLTATKDVA
ncbi:hypothetical protein ACFYZ8_33710 [Streptomyces sp. NPDC001668]|uniref:hypothetical protein n=1 Tax=Streptomyces sp. NPDC001668 TaxID=3364598 RepID=UPI00368C8BE3